MIALRVRPVAKPESHPVLAQAVTMPVNSALLVIRPHGDGGVHDVLLRTGVGGWRHGRQMRDGYLHEDAMLGLLNEWVGMGYQFHLATAQE